MDDKQYRILMIMLENSLKRNREAEQEQVELLNYGTAAYFQGYADAIEYVQIIINQMGEKNHE